jgi:hypothetical protein
MRAIASREGHGRLRWCDAGTAWRLSRWVSIGVGDGSRAAGVTDRWPGGARANQALCSNQTNHVAELRIQLTTRLIPGATVSDLRMADRAVDLWYRCRCQ